MAVGSPGDIADDVVVHRLGGAGVGNVQLSPLDEKLTPPGISVLRGGTPQDAADQMRKAFPKSRKWALPLTVATSTAGQIRAAGFEVVPDATSRFRNHARLTHPDELAGFTDANLQELAKVFQETTGC